jgi:hypothetical protein
LEPTPKGGLGVISAEILRTAKLDLVASAGDEVAIFSRLNPDFS